MSNKLRKIVSLTVISLIFGTMPVVAAGNNDTSLVPPSNIQQNPNSESYSHGSSTIVESPDNTVPEDYTVDESIQASAKKGKYSKLFDTEKLQDVNITISEDNWNYMLQNAIDKPNVLASSISIGDEKIENVGIKTKGNLTLNSVWASDSDRFSFTVNTKKFVSDQNFYGLEKFSLNNIYGDASMMKEYLSYELMTEMGIPTPYYCLVKLNVNGEFWGVYMMVEKVDKSLMKRTTGNSDGALYTAEAPGGDLIYKSDLDNLLNSDGTYNFDLSTYSDGSNLLSNYTGLLDNKEYGATISDYEEKEEEEVRTDLNNLFSWMKKLNELSSSENPNTEKYKKSVEEILDVDEILRYFAVNTYLVNLDSYQSEKEQNYCLYEVDGKVTIIPWDYNYSFGAYGTSSASEMINFSIDNPVINVTLAERPLLNVLLQNDEYREVYEGYLEDCAKIASIGGKVNGVTYEKDHFSTEIDNYKDILEEAVKTDPTAFYDYDRFISACDNLKKLNTQRATAVLNQINDDFSEVSSDGINLNEIGDNVGGAGQGAQGNPPGEGGPGNPGEGNPPEFPGEGGTGYVPVNPIPGESEDSNNQQNDSTSSDNTSGEDTNDSTNGNNSDNSNSNNVTNTNSNETVTTEDNSSEKSTDDANDSIISLTKTGGIGVKLSIIVGTILTGVGYFIRRR
ncbi:putative secreted protein [Clostridium bornimense]|uniref:Putative secreted protein n=1 Tax=Clostridium bornimense TaxID=1216932 RepID=W6RZR4_9CLOT|nr:CotH kinase family protein [Clostridium bornimense]CDM70151.1 putative secreted protein [Clostridium bornimense]